MDFNSLKELNAAFPVELNKAAESLRIELREAGKLKPGESKLSKTQISNLRKRLGNWTVNGEPVNFSKVGGFNNFINGDTDSITVPPKAVVPSDAIDPRARFDRPNLENVTDEDVGLSAARQLKKRVAVLDQLEQLKIKYKATVGSLGEKYAKPIVAEIQEVLNKHGGGQIFNPENIDNYGWGAIPKEEQNIKGLNKWINAGKRNIKNVIDEVEAESGIKGNIGHGWSALDHKGKRSVYDKLAGMNVGGKFSPTNIGFQPEYRSGKTVKMAQLDHWFYNLLTANKPHEQGATFQQLEDVYVGGQGWQRTLNDYITSADKNLNSLGRKIIQGGGSFNFATDLNEMEKSYILFGNKGTPEVRMAQVMKGREFTKSTGAQFNILEHIDEAGNYKPPARRVRPPRISGGGQQLFGGPFANRLFDLGTPTALLMSRLNLGLDAIDFGLPTEKTVNIAKEKGVFTKEAGISYLNDLAFKGTMYGTAKATLPKVMQTAATIGGPKVGGYLAGAGTFLTSPPGWALGVGLTLNEIDNLFGGPTKKAIYNQKENMAEFSAASQKGKDLTSIPDKTYLSSQEVNKIGSKELVKYRTQESTEWTTDLDVDEEPIPEYKYAPSLQLSGV